MKQGYGYVKFYGKLVERNLEGSLFATEVEGLTFTGFNKSPSESSDERALNDGYAVIKTCGGSSYYTL